MEWKGETGFSTVASVNLKKQVRRVAAKHFWFFCAVYAMEKVQEVLSCKSQAIIPRTTETGYRASTL